MYKRILVPTDGAALSRNAVEGAVLFARDIGATVIGLHILPMPREGLLEAWMHHDPFFPQQRLALLNKMADEFLSIVAECASDQGVACTCRKIQSDAPYTAIVKAAEELGCDLIYMASHGWRGETEHLGSVTVRVIHDSTVPVLVHKPRHDCHLQGEERFKHE